jgi:hypothetical protein
MKEKLYERLNKLLTVKSIVTILLTLVFCYLSIIRVVPVELFLSVFTVVISFYFGTQAKKE